MALSGASAIHRVHIAAAVGLITRRPVVLICADESEAERLAQDWPLADSPVPVLTPRSFTFHNAASVSRQWEHRRLSLMWELLQGKHPFLVATVEALLQRTMPREILKHCCRELKPGDICDLNQLAEDLSAAGYTRCEQVEGVGQFALRGGILDIFSPAMEQPVRVEFFGDEIDAMGSFDPSTQRRTENLDAALLLPAAEVLPQMAPGGLAGLAKQLSKLAAHALRSGNSPLSQTLERDGEAIAQGRTFPAMDRYLPLIYPETATMADYFPPDACLIFSECPRVTERAKTYQWQLEEDIKLLMEQGELDGSCGDLALTFPHLCQRLEDWACLYLDSFAASGYPTPPRALLSITAKQLSSFGGSLETAVQDLVHYQNSGYSSLVLVSGEQRALDLQTLLREQKVKAAVEFKLTQLPTPGAITITVGGLSSGLSTPPSTLPFSRRAIEKRCAAAARQRTPPIARS